MIAFLPLTDCKAQAKFSFSASAGSCLDQAGFVRMRDLTYDLTALMGVLEDRFSIGFRMSGGQWFNYQTTIKSMDLKRDSSVWRSTNAPALQGVVAFNIPSGDEGDPNRFAGPVAGFCYGLAFPDITHMPANSLKIFLQGNYRITGGVSTFLRPSFNAVYNGGSFPLYAWDVSLGFKFTVPNGSSGY